MNARLISTCPAALTRSKREQGVKVGLLCLFKERKNRSQERVVIRSHDRKQRTVADLLPPYSCTLLVSRILGTVLGPALEGYITGGSLIQRLLRLQLIHPVPHHNQRIIPPGLFTLLGVFPPDKLKL